MKKRTGAKAAPSNAANPANRRLAALLVALAVAGVAYFGLLPWIRQVQRNTAEIDRQTRELLRESGRVQNAQYQLHHLREAVRRSPQDGRLQFDLAAALKDSGQIEEALQHAREAVKDKTLGDQGYALLADLQYLAKDHYGAMKSFERALEMVPENAEVMRALGFLYISFGWTSDAVALLAPAAARFPDEAGIRSALALAFVQQNDYEKAETQLLAVRRLLPEDPVAWSPLVDVYVKANRHEDALRVAKEALSKMPADPRLLILQGRANLGLGRFAEARRNFEAVLKAQPENLEALYNVGVVYQKEQKPAEAMRIFEQVHSREPGYERTQLLLGSLYIQFGRADEGKRLIAAFREREPAARRRARLGYLLSTKSSDPEAHYRMALVYRSDGNLPRASTELRRTLELKPEHVLARRMLEELGTVLP